MSFSEKMGALTEAVNTLKTEVLGLRADVAELKATSARGIGWLDVLKTAGTVLALILSALALTSCDPPAHWGAIQPTVLLDSTMDEVCFDASQNGYAFWLPIRRDLDLIVLRDPSAPHFGEIRIRARPINMGTKIGNTHIVRVGSQLISADIILDPEWCGDTQVARHELGHALGLDHNLTSGSVMYPNEGGVGDLLTPQEIKWVRSLTTVK